MAAGLIVGGIFLYWISSVLQLNSSDIGFTILSPLFLLAHVILSVIYPIKNYPKKILIAMAVLFAIHVFVSQVDFSTCDANFKTGRVKSCDCLGLKKVGFFSSQCVGARINCYEYSRESGEKKEVPCI